MARCAMANTTQCKRNQPESPQQTNSDNQPVKASPAHKLGSKNALIADNPLGAKCPDLDAGNSGRAASLIHGSEGGSAQRIDEFMFHLPCLGDDRFCCRIAAGKGNLNEMVVPLRSDAYSSAGDGRTPLSHSSDADSRASRLNFLPAFQEGFPSPRPAHRRTTASVSCVTE